MSQFWCWQWWSLIYSLLPYIMNTPRVPIGTGTHSRPLGCQRRWWGGVGVDVEAAVESKETQVVMLGGTQGSTHHAVVPPHCAGSSSVPPQPPRPFGQTGEKEKREEGGWKGMKGGQDRRGSDSGGFWMDRGHVPIIHQHPCEDTLTKWSPVWPFTSSQCD